MENQNNNAADKVAANIAEERKHPIFEECEVMNAGKPAHEHMLSMNGMYISGITDMNSSRRCTRSWAKCSQGNRK